MENRSTKTVPETAVVAEVVAAIADDRLRIFGILDSAEGARNPEMARQLAGMGLAEDQARAILAKAPMASPYIAALESQNIGFPVAGAAGPGGDPFASNDARAERKAEIEALGAALRSRR